MAEEVAVSIDPHSTTQLAEDDGPSYLTVLLLGPSGVGKSTTGNKLLRFEEDTVLRRWNSLQFGLLQPEKENDTRTPKLIESTSRPFAVGEGTECKTRKLELLSSVACGVRVLDVPGFGDVDPDSDRVEGISDLQLIRKILAVQEELDLHFNLVLFFLPRDCMRADYHLIKRLQGLYNMFGIDIFKIMLVVATLGKFAMCTPENEHEFIKQCDQAFSTALQRALKGHYARIEKKPEVVFLPAVASFDTVQSLTLDKRPFQDKHIKLTFNPSRCYKCGQQLRKVQNVRAAHPEHTSDYRDLPEVHRKFQNTKPSREYKVLEGSTQFSNPDDGILTDTCHVAFLPRDSKLKRVAGRVFHFATFGVYYVVQKVMRREKIHWWDFEEVCINCQQGPGSPPCFVVGESCEVILDDGSTGVIVVQHRSFEERLVRYSELKQ